MSISEQVDYVRQRIPGVHGLPGASFVNDRINDATTIVTALPEIVVHLRIISQHIVSVDEEVAQMRRTVDRLEAQVEAMRGEMANLSGGIDDVGVSVGRLEPHISDISRIVRPFKHRKRDDHPPELDGVPVSSA